MLIGQALSGPDVVVVAVVVLVVVVVAVVAVVTVVVASRHANKEGS